MLENLSMMANMHGFWSLREGVFTFQVRFETGGYLASLKSCPWVRPSLFYSAKRNETKRNILGKRKNAYYHALLLTKFFIRLIVETASDSVDSTLYRNASTRSNRLKFRLNKLWLYARQPGRVLKKTINARQSENFLEFLQNAFF